MNRNWRKRVDPIIKDHLETQIKEASKHKNAYRMSSNPPNAQLWCAVANLSRQIFDVNLKLNYMERVLREISSKRLEKEKKQTKKTLKSF